MQQLVLNEGARQGNRAVAGVVESLNLLAPTGAPPMSEGGPRAAGQSARNLPGHRRGSAS